MKHLVQAKTERRTENRQALNDRTGWTNMEKRDQYKSGKLRGGNEAEKVNQEK